MIFDTFNLHTALQIVALFILGCLGWQAMAAVWGWITTGTFSTAAALGAIVILIVLILLAVGV